MKDKNYMKAFRFLSRKLREITGHRSATLGVINTETDCNNLYLAFRVLPSNSSYFYFADERGIAKYMHFKPKHLKTRLSKRFHFYSVGSSRKIQPEVFMKEWIEHAVGHDIYVSYYNPSTNDIGLVKLLSSIDTVETLAISYDMSNV